MPKTWILDPRPVPPHAVIPGLTVDGHSVSDWKVLASPGQKGRRFVIKPAGVSELAWGSRGVSVGHDLPQTEWAAALEAALASFHRVPRILQEFRKGRRVAVSYHDPVKDEIVPMPGRVRLSPYYFIAGERRTRPGDRKSTRLNSSHGYISYAVFCLKKKKKHDI